MTCQQWRNCSSSLMCFILSSFNFSFFFDILFNWNPKEFFDFVQISAQHFFIKDMNFFEKSVYTFLVRIINFPLWPYASKVLRLFHNQTESFLLEYRQMSYLRHHLELSICTNEFLTDNRTQYLGTWTNNDVIFECWWRLYFEDSNQIEGLSHQRGSLIHCDIIGQL